MALQKHEDFDGTKFKELILYIARKCEGDTAFGATKLNKVLFFSDFAAYRQLGMPITGARYQALRNGPAPRQLIPVRQEMERDGEIVELRRTYFGRLQKRLVAKREPNLRPFTGSEIAIVDAVIEDFEALNATELSGLSHDFVGWKYAALEEDIPYETALLTIGKVTPALIERGRELNRTYKWTARSEK
jgi:hypothetical protein